MGISSLSNHLHVLKHSKYFLFVATLLIVCLIAFFSVIYYKAVLTNSEAEIDFDISNVDSISSGTNSDKDLVSGLTENSTDNNQQTNSSKESNSFSESTENVNSENPNSTLSVSLTTKTSSSTSPDQNAETTTKVSVNGGPIVPIANGKTQRFELDDGTKVRMRVKSDVDNSSNNSVNISVDSNSEQEGGN